MALWQIPWWEGSKHSWQERWVLVALGGYKWILTGMGTYSGLGFIYPVIVANAQSIMKKPEHKV